MRKFLADHATELIGLFIAYISFFVPLRQYIDQRQLEEKDKRFTNYHKLIDQLVDNQPKLDKQIAIVFELRNYPEYFEITRRILVGIRSDWLPQSNEVKRAINEIDLTLNFIDKK